MRAISLHIESPSYPLIFHNFSLIDNGFIKIHEYSNKIVFISVHKVRELCLSMTLR